ncbi:hypothetical protein Pla123a_04980 [Posidoniimonas polymericola]|uniref:Uncharacterized protein n=1 Tax=Posidoniimonas polymericola TaxID=2528002 RepID=A0A5C5ZFR6_9BACT|nr:hypothetical protein [Posidoniimonas polymericola]TWT85691.1 hypothetical protein Pla123a_04980 [Posidoniimonas polymericola]
MPPTPPPGGLHVVVVHFPIALLFVVPLFVVLTAVTGLRTMLVCTLILMLLGVGAAFVATSTGDEAMNWMGEFDEEVEAEDDPYDVLDHHEEQAIYARNLFTALTVLYLGVGLLTTFYKPLAKIGPRILINLIFLGLWMYPVTELANAAHEGGRLVHQFGLRSPLAETVDAEEAEEEELDDEAADDDEDDDSADAGEGADSEDGDSAESGAPDDQPGADPAETDATPAVAGAE